MHKIAWSIIAVAIGLNGCGDDKVTQGGSKPKGSIIGTVTDLQTGLVLAAVEVTVLVTGDNEPTAVVSTTSETGTFQLEDLPAGAVYRVTFDLESYVSRFVDVLLQDSTGEFPQGNSLVEVNISLSTADSGVAGSILAEGGSPADGAVVRVDLRDIGYDLVVETTAASDGTYSLTNLPGSPDGLSIDVVVAPFDADGDGQADYDPVAVGARTYPGTTTTVDIDLRGASSDLELLSSDVDDGEHAAANPIDLVYNRPLDALETTATLRDSTADRNVAVVLSVSGNTLTVTPSGGTALAEAHDFQLSVNAQATNGATDNAVRVFQVVSNPGVLLPAVATLQVTPTNVNENTTNFSLSWDTVADATGYEVFVRDTDANPSYLLVRVVGSSLVPSTNVGLPGSFDWLSGDGRQTPFAQGVAVDFAVMPINLYGEVGDPGTATAVTRSDNVDPTLSLNQIGDADNSGGGSPRTIDLQVFFSEYMDPTSTVAISLPDVSMSAVFTFDAGLRTGNFEITIPASTDGRGAIEITGAADSSGNVMEPRDGSLF